MKEHGCRSAVHAQKARPATLMAADYIEIQQLVARYRYALDHGGDGSAYAALFMRDGSFGTQAKGTGTLSSSISANMASRVPSFSAGTTSIRM
jgi:hypothetical protein